MTDETPSPPVPPQAAELILQDERLTSDLEDDAANILLQWALRLAGQVVPAGMEQGQPLDRSAVADAVAPVRGLARQVNDLTAGRTDLDEREFVARLLALVDAAVRLARCQ